MSAEDPNIWALLMPAAYMLVPGSMIAKMWFNTIFPPINEIGIVEVNSTITEVKYVQQFDNVFSNLMVISGSLALGLILGFAVVQLSYKLISSICACSKVRVRVPAATFHPSRYSHPPPSTRLCHAPAHPTTHPIQCCQSDISRKRTESAESLTEDEKDELVALELREEGKRDRVLGMFTAPHQDPHDEESGARGALLAVFEDPEGTLTPPPPPRTHTHTGTHVSV